MSGDLVLVTGATGYLGSHCVKKLQEQGFNVRGSVRSLKNEDKIKFLYTLVPNAQHPLELVEADLTDAASWTRAVSGCKYILHVASPFHMQAVKDPEEFIKPAVDGTLNVLRAASEEKSVKRVVVTSSFAAIQDRPASKTGLYTEDDWSVPEEQRNLYVRSKTLAERAAWDFVKELPSDKTFEFATTQPTGIIGPVLGKNPGNNIDMVVKIMERKAGPLPKLNVPTVDVRDCAEAHIRTLTNDAAVGHRHTLMSQWIVYPDVAQILSEEFGPQGYSINTHRIPNPITSLVSHFNEELRNLWDFGKFKRELDTRRYTEVLGIQPIPLRKTVIDMGYSLIEIGLVKKTDKYRGPPAAN